jgi:hypothetical protein
MSVNKIKDKIYVISQGFYGNRTGVEIDREEVDRFILGYIDKSIPVNDEKFDRTIVRVPNTENIVIVYNKYQEEKVRQRQRELYKTEGYESKPLAFISEGRDNDIEIYSRCIVCGINENGGFESLQDNDYKKFAKYLAE